MRAIRDPNLAAHQADHALLVAECTVLFHSIREGGARRPSLETLRDLKSWLLGHTLYPDKELARFPVEETQD